MEAVNSEQGATNQSVDSSSEEVFTPKNTLDQPCDVVLVVQDGKQFKAHRKVLSEASPFFEKLLNSDMKEAKEGIVRLEMFSESVMAATLEFIYTGHVQISTEDSARDLIVMADYLSLQKLKTFAGEVLAQKLNISNCISTYYFSEKYQCEELLSKSKKFILANFTAVYAANREDVLNMSNKEVEMWISSDEIDVSAEEDVFKIILAWIDHEESNRKKYFAELFRHVRLIYVSRDFLDSDVVTNDLVKENEDCLDLVKDAMSLIDSKNCRNISVSPRKSLEKPAIVMCGLFSSGFPGFPDVQCYFPDEGDRRLCRLDLIIFECDKINEVFPCESRLYYFRYQIKLSGRHPMMRYDPLTNRWKELPPLNDDRYLIDIFAKNEGQVYCYLVGPLGKDTNYFISQYKPESHQMEDVVSFDHFKPRGRKLFCIVASDHFIYFIGGVLLTSISLEFQGKYTYLSDVDRYDMSNGQWDKVADIQVARSEAKGVALNGKLFIAGGKHVGEKPCDLTEMYDEATNEWQFIASIRKPEILDTILVAGGKLYAVCGNVVIDDSDEEGFARSQVEMSVECYNAEKNEWELNIGTTTNAVGYLTLKSHACSMRIFKGLSNIRPLDSTNSELDILDKLQQLGFNI